MDPSRRPSRRKIVDGGSRSETAARVADSVGFDVEYSIAYQHVIVDVVDSEASQNAILYRAWAVLPFVNVASSVHITRNERETVRRRGACGSSFRP